MMEEQIVDYALENTFPIAVTVYLLWERSKLTSKVTDQLTEVSKTLAVICDKLK